MNANNTEGTHETNDFTNYHITYKTYLYYKIDSSIEAKINTLILINKTVHYAFKSTNCVITIH